MNIYVCDYECFLDAERFGAMHANGEVPMIHDNCSGVNKDTIIGVSAHCWTCDGRCGTVRQNDNIHSIYMLFSR